jgi:hypothetical protein
MDFYNKTTKQEVIVMVSDISAYKHIPEYQALQKLDPSLKAPKGIIQKALKWIEKKVDSLSSLFKSQATILKEKDYKIEAQFNKYRKLDQDYEQIKKRMDYLTSSLKRLPNKMESKLMTHNPTDYIKFNELRNKLNKENLNTQKEIMSEINYIKSLYSFRHVILSKIQNKISDINRNKMKLIMENLS